MKSYSFPKSLKNSGSQYEGMFLKVQEPSISYAQVKPIFSFLGFKINEVASVFGVNESTISRWQNSENVRLDPLKSKVSIDIDHILKKGVEVLGSKEDLQIWLNSENEALGGIKPSALLKDPFKKDMLLDVLDAISWGNYM